MILAGTHVTRYEFCSPVTLDMHTVRLKPRSGGGQVLRRFSIHVLPEPVAQTELIDAEGNVLQNFWFSGESDCLTVSTEFEVEALRTNPYDFIPSSSAAVPMRLSADETALLKPALTVRPQFKIQALAQKIAEGCSGSSVEFVTRANGWIFENIRQELRESGNPRLPEETLALESGACRDSAVLLIALCRSLGIPARFVSGYQENGPDTERQDLHAWCEVWVPGGGWRGLDPTQGLAVLDRHIPVAASAFVATAAPVSGHFYSRHTVPCLPIHDIQLRVL